MCEDDNSSTAQQLKRRAANFVAIVSMIAAAGCGGALSAGIVEQPEVQPSVTRTEIDAGIVFADRESYLCLSLEQLGLARDDAVTFVSSSCECVQPSVVSYRSSREQNAYAILLRFAKEEVDATTETFRERSSNSAITPASLGVIIDLKLADGSVRKFTVNLLHTSLAQEVAP